MTSARRRHSEPRGPGKDATTVTGAWPKTRLGKAAQSRMEGGPSVVWKIRRRRPEIKVGAAAQENTCNKSCCANSRKTGRQLSPAKQGDWGLEAQAGLLGQDSLGKYIGPGLGFRVSHSSPLPGRPRPPGGPSPPADDGRAVPRSDVRRTPRAEGNCAQAAATSVAGAGSLYPREEGGGVSTTSTVGVPARGWERPAARMSGSSKASPIQVGAAAGRRPGH